MTEVLPALSYEETEDMARAPINVPPWKGTLETVAESRWTAVFAASIFFYFLGRIWALRLRSDIFFLWHKNQEKMGYLCGLALDAAGCFAWVFGVGSTGNNRVGRLGGCPDHAAWPGGQH